MMAGSADTQRQRSEIPSTATARIQETPDIKLPPTQRASISQNKVQISSSVKSGFQTDLVAFRKNLRKAKTLERHVQCILMERL